MPTMPRRPPHRLFRWNGVRIGRQAEAVRAADPTTPQAPVARGAGRANAVMALLAAVAVLLIRESRGLLVGEGVSPEVAAAIRELALRHRLVCAASRPLSMYFGPDDVLVTLDVQFDGGADAASVANAVSDIESDIRKRYPRIRRIYIEGRPAQG